MDVETRVEISTTWSLKTFIHEVLIRKEPVLTISFDLEQAQETTQKYGMINCLIWIFQDIYLHFISSTLSMLDSLKLEFGLPFLISMIRKRVYPRVAYVLLTFIVLKSTV